MVRRVTAKQEARRLDGGGAALPKDCERVVADFFRFLELRLATRHFGVLHALFDEFLRETNRDSDEQTPKKQKLGPALRAWRQRKWEAICVVPQDHADPDSLRRACALLQERKHEFQRHCARVRGRRHKPAAQDQGAED